VNTEQIDRVIRRHLKDFDVVFSVDTLPDNPRLLVANTDPAHRPGQHWIAICIKDGCGEFFDSLGRRPSVDFERYMNRHCSSWIFNDRQLQSVTSKFCVHYCICYCVFRRIGVDMRKITASFTSDTALDDILVHAMVCRR